MIMLLILLLFVVLLIYWCHVSCQRPLNFPPGPRPWPVIGNFGSIFLKLIKVKCHHLVWEEWAKKYGNILGLKLGADDVIIVFGKDLIKEVANRPEFDGRPGGFFYTLRSFGKKAGIVFSDGPSWMRKRKVVQKYLRIFGYGSRTMECLILEESKALGDLRSLDCGVPVPVNNMFDVSIVNILWSFVAGKRFEISDERLKTLCRLIKRSFKVADMSGGILNYLPFLRHVMPDLTGYTELKNVWHALHMFVSDTIEQHKSNVNIYQPRDVIDAFLIDMMRHNKEERLNNEDLCTEEELQVVCLDLLQAGADTTANTLVFLILYMIRHPEIQELVHNEIDRVCEDNRQPVLDDRIRMPYVEAVLMEVLRISTVAPVGIAHMATKNTMLDKFAIRKGALVLLSIHSMHMNNYWNDTATFRPERFLNDEGIVIQNDWLMPFGAGRRRCIGEGLARSELFLFFTTLMQRFTVTNPEGVPLPDTEPVNGITLSAKPFKAVFNMRKKQY